jgi:hypothetical protein
VEHHVSAIYAKLDVTSRTAAIDAARELGIGAGASAQKYAPLISDYS